MGCIPVISADVPFTYYVQVKMKMASDAQWASDVQWGSDLMYSGDSNSGNI